MASYAPVITIDTDAAVQAAGAGISYDELINSFPQYNFNIESIFLQSVSIEQILQPLLWSSYDVNGLKNYSVMPPSPDPYQKQPTILLDMTPENILINGRSQLNFNLLPQASWSLLVMAQRNYIADYLALKNRKLI